MREGFYSHTILWAEDDQDDREFFQSAIDIVGQQLNCHFVGNGSEVLSYLEQASHDKHPCLIVLDINMPIMDGITTFQYLKSDNRFKAIPTAIVSTAKNIAVRNELSNYDVVFLSKPDTIKGFVELVLELLLMAGIGI